MIRPPATLLLALEHECLTVDNAIAARAWPVCEASWQVQRRLTHELDIAMRGLPPDSIDLPVARRRIERLRRYRDGQLRRLRSFNESVAKRLATLERFKSFSKVAAPERRSRLLDVRY